MAFRSLRIEGQDWDVWDVRPSASERLLRTDSAAPLAQGWLCFESQAEKRRVVPIPEEWEGWSDEELTECWSRGTPVERRSAAGARFLGGADRTAPGGTADAPRPEAQA